MMKWRTTWALVGAAVALFAFIFFFERHMAPTTRQPAPPARLLPQFKAAEVNALAVRYTNLLIRVERDGDSWRLTAPLVYPAAPVAVERLLLALERAVITTRIPPREMTRRNQTPADYALHEPQAVVVVERAGDRQEVRLGGRTAAGDQVYAQVVGGSDVVAVDATLLNLLPQSANEWRDLALLRLDRAECDRVEVVKASGGFLLQRDATNRLWQLGRSRQRADQFKVEGLLEKLQQARVTQFVTDDPKADLDAFGLQSPVLELVVSRGTNHVQRLQFGTSPPGDPAHVYVRRLSHTNVVVAPKDLLDALALSAADLRDRRLLGFALGSVSLIEVRSEEPFTVRKQSNDVWVAGETIVADGPFLRDWLQRLSGLQVSEFVKDVVTDFSSYGLAPPHRQYLLKTTVTNGLGAVSNVVLGEIHFGTNQNDKVFVRRADEDSVYAIRMLDYYRMPGAAWQLRDRRVWHFTTNQVARVTVSHGGRSRTLLRSETGEWTVAPGAPGNFEPFSPVLEEILHRLGDLHATLWVARGAENLPRYGFGEANLHVVVELKGGDSPQLLKLDFGGPTPARFPYAATTMDGQVWIFEFPWFLFQEMERAFGLPLG